MPALRTPCRSIWSASAWCRRRWSRARRLPRSRRRPDELHPPRAVADPGSTRDLLAQIDPEAAEGACGCLVGDIGGGFGQKTSLYPEDGIVAYAATKLNKKIRWRGDRTDEFVGGTHGRDLTSTGEFALDAKRPRAGLSRALDRRHRAPIRRAPPTSSRLCSARSVQTGVYDLPLVHFEVKSVMTTTAPVGAYRGAGRPRRCSSSSGCSMPRRARSAWTRAPSARQLHQAGAAALHQRGRAGVATPAPSRTCWSRASDLADWNGFAARKKAAKKKACSTAAGLDQATSNGPAAVPIPRRSRCTPPPKGASSCSPAPWRWGRASPPPTPRWSPTRSAIADGQDRRHPGRHGSRHRLRQRRLCARCSSAAPRSRSPTNDMINKARDKASNLLEASVEDIEYRDGFLTVVGTDRRISLFEIAAKEERRQALGRRARARSTGRAGRTAPISARSRSIPRPASRGWCATPRSTTSASRSTRCWCTGQIHGGVAQGIGQALYEGVAYSEEGQLLTASYQDYCVPRAGDIPPLSVTLDPLRAAARPIRWARRAAASPARSAARPASPTA